MTGASLNPTVAAIPALARGGRAAILKAQALDLRRPPKLATPFLLMQIRHVRGAGVGQRAAENGRLYRSRARVPGLRRSEVQIPSAPPGSPRKSPGFLAATILHLFQWVRRKHWSAGSTCGTTALAGERGSESRRRILVPGRGWTDQRDREPFALQSAFGGLP